MNMNQTTKWAIAAVVVIVLVILGITFGSNREPENTQAIKIGAPLGLTGSSAVDALSIKRGIDLAVTDLSKKGVVIDVVYEDDGTDPKRTVSAVTKLINVDKVDFLIGPTWSFLTDAASPVFNQAKVVSFAPANTSEFSNGGQYGFYGATKNAQKRAPVTKWLKDNNATKVAIILDKGAWGASNLSVFKAAAADAGAEVVFVEEIPFGQESSIPTILTKMVSAKPDVLLTTGYDQGMTLTITKSQELQINIPILFATEIVTGLVKNKIVTLQSTDNFYLTNSVVDNSFRAKFKEVYGEEPGSYADRAYDGVMLLAEAMRKKDAGQSLDDFLRKETKYKGYGAVYDFDEKGDIVGGEWVITKLTQ
ncbi:MAG: ABC transporter substrate-binding protein [Candidatus Paceibacterota bacterium]